jgi:hypothetical protein
MIRKGTWIVLAVFVVFIGTLLILQRTRGNVKFITEAVTPSATSAPLLLQGWQPADINYIEWRGEGQSLTLTQSADGAWLLGPDQNAPVESSQVDSLRSSLVSLRPLSSLGASNPLDALGLSAPLNIITLRAASGMQAQFLLGDTTPTGSGYYAQINGGAPVVISKFELESILEQLKPGVWATPTPQPALETPAATAAP